MFLDPSSVKEEDFNYVYDLLLRDEALTVGVLEVILRDHNVRTELGMGSQAEADAYVGNVRYAIQTSRTWQDWVEKAKDFGFLGPFVCGPTVCAAAVVWAAALTVALAWNYVYVANVAVAVNVTFATASGTATAMESSQMMPAQPPHLFNIVRNETSRVVWVVLQGPTGSSKRLAVPPGFDSTALGIADVAAILIGGESNALAMLRLPNGQIVTKGAYVLARSADCPAVVTILEHDHGRFSLSESDTQSAACLAGNAGYSDLLGGGTAKSQFDTRWNMSESASAVPVGFDVASLGASSEAVEFFSRMRRLAASLELIGIKPTEV